MFLLGGCGAAGGAGLGPSTPAPGPGEGALRGELGADVVELLSAAPDLVAMDRDAEYLERALASDAALERRARRRAWSDGAVARAGHRVHRCGGRRAAGRVDAGHHRPPAARTSWPPCCRWPHWARSRWWPRRPTPSPGLADHREAAGTPGGRGRPADTGARPGRTRPPCPTGADVALEDAVLRYDADGPRVLDGLSPRRARGTAPRPDRAERGGQEQHRQRPPALLGPWSPAPPGWAARRSTDLAQDAVRSRIAWVGQDAHLFPTTIGGNIAVARPGATTEEIAEAARRAQLGPWIDALPDGHGHPGRRAGCPAVRRPAPTGGPGPGTPGRRSGAGARRAHGRASTAPRPDGSSTTW